MNCNVVMILITAEGVSSYDDDDCNDYEDINWKGSHLNLIKNHVIRTCNNHVIYSWAKKIYPCRGPCYTKICVIIKCVISGFYCIFKFLFTAIVSVALPSFSLLSLFLLFETFPVDSTGRIIYRYTNSFILFPPLYAMNCSMTNHHFFPQ